MILNRSVNVIQTCFNPLQGHKRNKEKLWQIAQVKIHSPSGSSQVDGRRHLTPLLYFILSQPSVLPHNITALFHRWEACRDLCTEPPATLKSGGVRTARGDG